MSTQDKSLETRISDLEAKTERVPRFEGFIRSLTMLGAVSAFAWGLFQHFDAKRMEFRKAFWEKQYDLYSRATRAAAKISIAPNLEAVQTERVDFWSLYWGDLSIVESKAVHDAMVAYGNKLSELENAPQSANDLRTLSYRLARACRESLKKTWEPVPLDDIPVKTAVN